MRDIIIHKPVKKDTHYSSRITTTSKRGVKLRIPYSVIKQSMLLSNKHGHLIDIQVPENDFAMEAILSIEKSCVAELIKNNSKWFDNSLNEDKIPTLLESCVHDDNCLQIYSSNIRSVAVFNNSIISVSDWLEKNPIEVSLTIFCDGMFIYPTRFGLRWIISEIKECENNAEDICPDIGELEEFWKDKATQYLKAMLIQKEKLDKKISEVNSIIDSFGISELDSNVDKLKSLMDEWKTFL